MLERTSSDSDVTPFGFQWTEENLENCIQRSKKIKYLEERAEKEKLLRSISPTTLRVVDTGKCEAQTERRKRSSIKKDSFRNESYKREKLS